VAAAIPVTFGAEGIGKLLIANRSVGPAGELTHKLRGAGLRVEVSFLDALNEAALKAEVIRQRYCPGHEGRGSFTAASRGSE
jgi:glutamyl-tRNA reductase